MDGLTDAIDFMSVSPLPSPTLKNKKDRRNSAPPALDDSSSPKSSAEKRDSREDIRHDPAYEAFYRDYKGDEELPPPVRGE